MVQVNYTSSVFVKGSHALVPLLYIVSSTTRCFSKFHMLQLKSSFLMYSTVITSLEKHDKYHAIYLHYIASVVFRRAIYPYSQSLDLARRSSSRATSVSGHIVNKPTWFGPRGFLVWL